MTGKRNERAARRSPSTRRYHGSVQLARPLRLAVPLLLWPLLLASGPVLSVDQWLPPLAAGEPGVDYGTIVLPIRADLDDPAAPVELVVTAPSYGGTAGQLRLVTPPSGPDWKAQPGALIVQGEAGDQLGRSVAAGDFNGDGLTDLAVAGKTGSHGTVRVLWGEIDGWSEPYLLYTGAWALGDELGSSLAAGDLDGDGIDDLAVGAYSVCWGLWQCGSRVLLFRGDPDLGPDLEPGEWPPVATLSHATNAAGAVLRADLDWNCDGHPDLTTGGGGGALSVLVNPTDGGDPVGWFEDADFAALEEVLTLSGVVSTSLQLAEIDDVTGDACADLLVASPGLQEARGELMLIPGRTSGAWAELGESPSLDQVAWMRRRGHFPTEQLGFSMVPVRWTQAADSGPYPRPDLLLGAPEGLHDSGYAPGLLLFVEAADLFGGPDAPVPQDQPGDEPADFATLTDLATLQLQGREEADELGLQAAAWQDLDGDGLPDAVVMARGYHLDAEEAATGGLFALPSASLLDGDGDGVIAWLDCDDDDPARFVDNPEVCDGLDNDCDEALSAAELDDDGDGVTECDGDCDDAAVTVLPGAVEICDGLDNDCDGRLWGDELDDDGDGYSECEGDCRDDLPDRYPGAPGRSSPEDTDCDGASDWVGGWTCAAAASSSAPGLLLLLPLLAALRRRADRSLRPPSVTRTAPN